MIIRAYERYTLRAVSALFAFAVVCLFAILSVLLVVIGIQVYKQVTVIAEKNSELRTSINYVVNKVHSQGGSGRIGIEKIEGISALSFTEDIEGEEYSTYIYCYNGSLYEMFISSDSEFDPEQGEELVKAADFYAALSGKGLEFTIIGTDNTQYSQFVMLQASID